MQISIQVTKFEDDLGDGLLLIDLLEKLAAPNKVGRYSKDPKGKVHMVTNVGTALTFIANQNIKLVNIGELLVINIRSNFFFPIKVYKSDHIA